MICMMGFPVNEMYLAIAEKKAKTETERKYLKSQLGISLGIGTTLVSNALSILVVSILTLFI